jgi:hypothetical protein
LATGSAATSAAPSFVAAGFPDELTIPGASTPEPVLTVAEAIARREAAEGDDHIVVGGWFVFNPVPCAQLPDSTTPLEDCAVDFSWLMDVPERLDSLASDGSGSIHAPSGPAINVVLGYVDWQQPSYVIPRPFAAVGHFDDRRSEQCPAGDRRARCRDRFVVDAVLWTGDGNNDVSQVPTSVFGLQVQGIAGAIGVRATGSSEEIAIAGWYDTPWPGAMFCPFSPGPGPRWLYGRCEDAYRWLMADPEPLVHETSSGGTMTQPDGPAIQLAFPTVQPPRPNGPFTVGDSIPQPAVLVGHFNDRRSTTCQGQPEPGYPDIEAECRSRFVVDAVGWLNGRVRQAAVMDRRDDTQPLPTPLVDPLVAIHVGNTILDVTTVPGSALSDLEPGLIDVKPELLSESSIWLVTILMPVGCTLMNCPISNVAEVLLVTVDGRVYDQFGRPFRSR